MGDQAASSTAGVTARGYQRGAGSGNWDQFVVPVEDKVVSYRGRVGTFITPGRAAVSQKIFAIHNATGSTVLVSVNRIIVDVLHTAVKAVTVTPPVIRLHRFTAVPTNGTALTKNPLDTSLSSSASVTAWGDASADGTGSGTTLTVTIPSNSIIDQKYGPRVFTAVGYEPIDTGGFLIGEPDVTLRALEGVAVFLDAATVTTGNPSTDRWSVMCDWTEYTRP